MIRNVAKTVSKVLNNSKTMSESSILVHCPAGDQAAARKVTAGGSLLDTPSTPKTDPQISQSLPVNRTTTAMTSRGPSTTSTTLPK